MDERRAKILAVAAELFATRGYTPSTVDEIGTAAGISGPALYRYFPNKQALLDEICLSSFQSLSNSASAIVREGTDPSETLARLIAMRVEFAYGPHRRAFVILQAADTTLSSGAARKLAAMRELYKAEWMRVVAEVRPDSPTEEIQVAWFASQILIGYMQDSAEIRDENEHRRHFERMAMAVLLA
ncbi:hypothetical protein GCM10009836_60950 [Pseudonocardia ailaonensis]|uniref:HTH tetR-type domain-containing protein n=1 Tax=Pseudonocardia ailaonensis TaxID=367279 RepID=A0ABN2NJD8_9PSEU